jgi:AcrR family transcriptional regulator
MALLWSGPDNPFPRSGKERSQVGEEAVTEVLAGAEETGAKRASSPQAPKLRLASSPKRERILEGMLEAVGADGYDATSVRTVLDRAGLYRQAFYDNFTDRDSCYLEAFDAGVARAEGIVTTAAADEETWRGRLRAGLGALLDLLEAEPDVGRALIVEVHAAGPAALEKRAEAMKRIAAFVDRARLETGESESPPRIAAEGVVAGIHAVVHSRLSNREDQGLRGLLPEFMYFAVLPYFGVEAAGAEMQAARA